MAVQFRIRRSILHPFCRSNGERPQTEHPRPYSERVSPVVFTAPEGHSTRWAIRAFLSAANETRPSPSYIYAPLFTQLAPRRALAKQHRTLPPIFVLEEETWFTAHEPPSISFSSAQRTPRTFLSWSLSIQVALISKVAALCFSTSEHCTWKDESRSIIVLN